MNSNPHIALPLEWLFTRLEAAGFAMDTARKLRLLRALEREGHRYVGRWDDLKYLLAPFVARTAEEQRLFYEIYAEFQRECGEELDRLFAAPAEKAERTEPVAPAPAWKRYWWGIFPILAVLTWIAIEIFKPEPPFYVYLRMDKNVEAREGTVLHVRNQTNTIFNGQTDTTGFRWEVRDAATGELEYADTTYDLRWPARSHGEDKLIILRGQEDRKEIFEPAADSLTLLVQCSNPPRIDSLDFPASPLVRGQSYTFTVFTEPGVEVQWEGLEPEEEKNNGTQIRGAFLTGGTATLRLRVYRPEHPEDCYVQVARNFSVGAEKPFLETASLRLDEPRLRLQLAEWYWLLLLIPLLPAAWFFERWRSRRREKPAPRSPEELEAAYPIHDTGPYYVPYLPQNEKITVPPAFFRIADVLRRREAGIRKVFDVTGSVRATTESGGFPSWRDRPLTRPAEYLMLVRRTDERQQQDRLFQRLALFLQRRDAPVTIFYHDGRFERFRNERFPEGLPLNQLYRRYPDYRLVVVGDGHGLVNPYAAGQPALLSGPATELRRWSRRLLITPEAPVDWSFQEALLHRQFWVFPATTAGILDGVEALDRDEEYIPIHFSHWQEAAAAQYDEPGGRYRTWDRMADLRDFLSADPGLYRWLCALAVTDQPDWALTIAVGRALGLDVTHDRLLRLSRIPWLAENRTPNELRLALLAELDPADEHRARQAVAEELERVQEKVEHSFAQSEWTANLALQHFALNPRDEQHKQTIRELRDLGLLSAGQLAELDRIVRERADTQGLPTRANRDLDAWLETPEPRPAFTTDLALSALFFVLLIAMGLFGRHYNNRGLEAPADQELAFWQAAYPLDDEALRLNNQAVGIGRRLDSLTVWQAFSTRGDSMTVADSLLARAVYEREPAGYPLADSNQVSLRFNYAARRLNFYLADSADRNVLQRLPDEFLQAITPERAGEHLRLAALHGHGLSLYYLATTPAAASLNNVGVRSARTLALQRNVGATSPALDPILLDSARQVRQFILDNSNGAYFDSIGATMPVNLATLLDALAEAPVPEQTVAQVEPPPARVNLTGRVLDAETREPLVGILVRAGDARRVTDETLAAGTAPDMLTATTDLDGRYTLRNVSTVKKQLQLYAVAPRGYESATDRSKGLEALPDLLLQPVARAAGDPEQSVQQAPPPADDAIRGRVLDAATGQPLGGVTVELAGQTATTDALNGAYAITPAQSQRSYRLTFTREGYRPQEATAYQSGETLPDVRLERAANKVIEPEMVLVQGGTFTMGCLPERDGECEKNELPAHEVRISTFYMGKFEVTNEEFAAFLNDYGSDVVLSGPYAKQPMVDAHQWGVQKAAKGNTWQAAPGYERHPVVMVSWFGAYTYAQWLSEKTGKNYRLPTEAEWEYAARGGANSRGYRYAGSDEVGEVAWYGENSGDRTHSIDETAKVLRPNELGLYNMSGNVWEWCMDWYGADYYRQFGDRAAVDPLGPETGDARVLRGGSWSNYGRGCHVAVRYWYDPRFGYYFIGFRVAQD